MTEQHTPGPWFAVNTGTDEEPMMVVRAARIAGQEPRHEVAICCTGDSPQEMENANAALIASAPDLKAENEKLKEGLQVFINTAKVAVYTDHEAVKESIFECLAGLSNKDKNINAIHKLLESDNG